MGVLNCLESLTELHILVFWGIFGYFIHNSLSYARVSFYGYCCWRVTTEAKIVMVDEVVWCGVILVKGICPLFLKSGDFLGGRLMYHLGISEWCILENMYDLVGIRWAFFGVFFGVLLTILLVIFEVGIIMSWIMSLSKRDCSLIFQSIFKVGRFSYFYLPISFFLFFFFFYRNHIKINSICRGLGGTRQMRKVWYNVVNIDDSRFLWLWITHYIEIVKNRPLRRCG